jgi:hypothetical protein
MDWLEQELQQALSRKEPPDGFAERVDVAASRPWAGREAYPTRWLAIAASVVVLIGGAMTYRHHQGEVAKQQVMTAMRITAVKLNHIQARVLEVRQ